MEWHPLVLLFGTHAVVYGVLVVALTILGIPVHFWFAEALALVWWAVLVWLGSKD